MTRGSSVALLALALSALAAAGQPPACPGSVKTDDSSVSCEAYCKGTGSSGGFSGPVHVSAGQMMDGSTCTCRCTSLPCRYCMAAAGPPACPGSVKTHDFSVSCEAYCKGTGFDAGQMMDDKTGPCRCRTIRPDNGNWRCRAGAVDTWKHGNSLFCYYDLCSVEVQPPACPGSVKTDDSSVSCEAYCKGTGFSAGQMMDGSTCRCRTIIHPEPSTCAAGAVDTAAIGNSKICYYDSCSLGPPACPGSVKTHDNSVSCDAYCKDTAVSLYPAAGQMMDDKTGPCRCRAMDGRYTFDDKHPGGVSSTCAAGAVDTWKQGNALFCYYDSCSIAAAGQPPACPGSVKTDDSSVSCEAYCKGTGFAAGQMMDGSTCRAAQWTHPVPEGFVDKARAGGICGHSTCRCRTIVHPEPSTCAAGAVDTATIGNSKICYYDSCSLPSGPPACPGSVKTDDSSVSCDAYCTGTGSAAGQMTNDNACRCRTIHPEPSTCAAGAVDTWKYQNSLYCYYDSCFVEVPKDAGAISTAEKAQMPAAQQGHGATARAFLLGAALAAPMGAALTYLALRSGRKLPASEPLLQQ